MKDERLRVFWAPILVENLHSIRGSYGVHAFAPFERPRRSRTLLKQSAKCQEQRVFLLMSMR